MSTTEQLSLLPRLIKGTFAHGLGGVASSLVNFALLFVYSKYLSPETYGVLAILLIIQVFCEVFPSLGMNGSIMMLYYKKENAALKAQLINTTFLSTIFMSVLVGFLLLPSSTGLSTLIFGGEATYGHYIFLAGLCGVIQNSISFPKVYFRIQEKDTQHAMADVAQAILKFVLVYYFLVVLDKGLLGVLQGSLISLAITWAFLNAPMLRYIKSGISLTDLKSLISLGWPLIFAWIANWGLNSLDRLFLNHFIDLKTVGVYAFAFQLAMALRVVLVAPVEKIWPSMLFQTEDHTEIESRYKGVMTLFLIGSCLAVSSLVLFADEIFYFLLSSEYHQSRQYLSIAAIVPLLMGLNVLVSSGARLKRKMTFFPKALFATVVIGFFLNLLFVKLWGSMGIATATLITLLSMNLIYYWYSQKVHPINFGIKNLIFASLYLLSLSILHIFVFDLDWLTSLSQTQALSLFAVKLIGLCLAVYWAWAKTKRLEL